MNGCIGCTALGYDDKCTNGFDQDMSKDNPCPCMNCIVKMVCRNECREYFDYALKIWSARGNKKGDK